AEAGGNNLAEARGYEGGSAGAGNHWERGRPARLDHEGDLPTFEQRFFARFCYRPALGYPGAASSSNSKGAPIMSHSSGSRSEVGRAAVAALVFWLTDAFVASARGLEDPFLDPFRILIPPLLYLITLHAIGADEREPVSGTRIRMPIKCAAMLYLVGGPLIVLKLAGDSGLDLAWSLVFLQLSLLITPYLALWDGSLAGMVLAFGVPVYLWWRALSQPVEHPKRTRVRRVS
ncbi:MAG: hypothetical protein RL885_25550, partial [Planctomycetota bacterium]